MSSRTGPAGPSRLVARRRGVRSPPTKMAAGKAAEKEAAVADTTERLAGLGSSELRRRLDVLRAHGTCTNLVITDCHFDEDANAGSDVCDLIAESTTLTSFQLIRPIFDGDGGKDVTTLAHQVVWAVMRNTAPLAKLWFVHVPFASDTWGEFAEYMGNASRLKELRLESIKVGGSPPSVANTVALAAALVENTVLSKLCLVGNNHCDEDARSFSDMLDINTSLRHLDVSNNNIGDVGAAALAMSLNINGTLAKLLAANNNVGDLGVAVLSTVLQQNISLTDLDLSGNPVEDDGALYLARALRVNVALATLRLYDTAVGDAGVGVLSRVFDASTTLSFIGVSARSAE